MRAKRSLAFNVGYCGGFENAATFSSKYLLERCDSDFAGADPGGANLFLWHVAEEFEHIVRRTHLFASSWLTNRETVLLSSCRRWASARCPIGAP